MNLERAFTILSTVFSACEIPLIVAALIVFSNKFI